MISPEVIIDDGKGTVLISAEEEDNVDILKKTLSVSAFRRENIGEEGSLR